MEKLLTPDQIATLLEVKKSTIYNWTHTGYIPHIKLGKLVRFKKSDILKWLDKKSNPGRKTMKIGIENLIK